MKHIAKTKKTQIYVRSLLAIAVSMSLFCTACAARPQPRAEGESAEAQDELSESALSPESAASPLVSPEPSDGKEPESEAMEKGAETSVSLSIEEYSAVNSPTQVAEGAVMVWTGSAEDNIDCQDISELRHVNPRGLENTIVLKEDGTYRACGMGLGTEKTLKYYWGLYDYSAVCTSEFVQVDGEQVFSPDFAWGQSFVDSEDGG